MFRQKISRITKFFDLELLFWIAALIYLALINPYFEGHFQLCGFKLLGFESCPGCGLGKSISFIFHGDLSHSLDSHPLGLFAIAVILYRIFSLINGKLKTGNISMEVYNG